MRDRRREPPEGHPASSESGGNKRSALCRMNHL